ncbi:hypothetical protein [Shewanella algae]|uniref:hypothetical protein n=1 Tax=Shewanella algae TaxID=38313 RepID=UPI0031F5D4FB
MFNVYPTNPELGKVTKYAISIKVSFLRSHFRKIEKVFEEESACLFEQCKLEDERTKDHEDDSQVDYRPYDELREIEFVYLRMHRYSAVLAAYSYLESSLTKICVDIQEKNEIRLSVSEINGNGINRCKIYLEKLASIDFEAINGQWSNLQILNKVRNCIMHADGNAEKIRSSANLISNIESNADLSFIEKRLIMMTGKYVENILNDIERTLQYIVEKSYQ